MNLQAGRFSDEDRYAIAFQKGDERGLAFFFDNYYPALCLYASWFTHNDSAAEDVVSDVFLKAWKKHDEFLSAGSIRAYLYVHSRYRALSWYRKETLGHSRLRRVAESIITKEGDHSEKIIAAEVVRHLHNMINTLPPECRKVFKMLYIEGMSISETAEALQISPSTVKTQKKRGLDALRKKSLFVYLLLVELYRNSGVKINRLASFT